jgi:uncharacterized RDD family membrane protein YckC
VTQQTGYGEPIVTGEAVAIELRPAGIGSRGIALVIDFVIQFVLLMLLVLISDNTGASFDSAAAQALVLVLVVGLVLGYPVGFESLWRGRTPGKAVMGLRVVRDDGGPIRFRHAFVRGLVGVVVDRPGIFAGLLALIPMLVSARSKRLGDFAAGTVVIQERVPSRAVAPPVMPPQLAGWAGGLDLTRLTDDLALEVRHFLARAPQLAPWAREQMGSRLVAELSNRTVPPPAGVPPWAYLTAVLAERRRREIDRLTNGGLGGPPAPVSPPPGITPPDPPAAQRPSAGPFAPPA